MKILFLTTGEFENIEMHGVYQDLLRMFMNNGHDVYIVSSREKRKGLKTELVKEGKAHHLLVKIGNLTKTNIVEKGISTLAIKRQYTYAIKKYFSKVKFNLILYSTPPITIVNAIKYVKNRDGANTYLMLKDIFPQNAVDLGMIRKDGIKKFIYRYFRKEEKKLYELSDYIGCMSQANVDYVMKNNPQISSKIVEICPNSIEVSDKAVNMEIRNKVRKKYGIPQDKLVFVYGGNLGKPQGIDFLIKCIHSQRMNKRVFFLIVGSGTEYERLEYFGKKYPQDNFKLMQQLPKEVYDTMIGACDVGMIFLDHRFTIPNIPSRLLNYMQVKIPILACTDPNTDIGKIIVDGEFGWWCESNDLKGFSNCVNRAIQADLKIMGEKGYQYLLNNYSVKISYKVIMRHFIV